jgi:uncharacterized protein (TIGR02646 family)
MRSIVQGSSPACLAAWSIERGDWSDFVHKDHECRAAVFSALFLLGNNHCAYCDRVLAQRGADSDRRPHIEHLVPRSFRPRLTFSWENLLVSCTGRKHCGQAKSNDTTPILDPRLQNPEGVLVLRPLTGFIEASADGTCASCRELGEQTIRVLRLNEPILTEHRRNVYRQWEAVPDGAADNDIDDGDFGVLILAARRPPRATADGRCRGCGGAR